MSEEKVKPLDFTAPKEVKSTKPAKSQEPPKTADGVKLFDFSSLSQSSGSSQSQEQNSHKRKIPTGGVEKPPAKKTNFGNFKFGSFGSLPKPSAPLSFSQTTSPFKKQKSTLGESFVFDPSPSKFSSQGTADNSKSQKNEANRQAG